MCLIKWAIELKNRDMVLVSTKIPCVLLCNYLLLHIFWEEFEPHNRHVFLFFFSWFLAGSESSIQNYRRSCVFAHQMAFTRFNAEARARALPNRFAISSSSPPPPSPGRCFLACRECKSVRAPVSAKKKQRTRTTRKVKIHWRRVADWDRHNLRVKPYFRLKVNSIHFLPEHWCHFNSSQEFQVFQNECRMSTTLQQPPPRKVFIKFQSIFCLSPLPIVM
jgi:hypothetical protein